MTQMAQSMSGADAQVSRSENGRAIPQRCNLEAIANALGVRAETFLLDDCEDDDALQMTA